MNKLVRSTAIKIVAKAKFRQSQQNAVKITLIGTIHLNQDRYCSF